MADLDIAVVLRDRFDEDEFVAGQTHWGRCGIWRDFREVCDCYAMQLQIPLAEGAQFLRKRPTEGPWGLSGSSTSV